MGKPGRPRLERCPHGRIVGRCSMCRVATPGPPLPAQRKPGESKVDACLRLFSRMWALERELEANKHHVRQMEMRSKALKESIDKYRDEINRLLEDVPEPAQPAAGGEPGPAGEPTGEP